jgi:hypothetical protein
MTVCTIDNLRTMLRECWQDGKLLCSYSVDVFFLKDKIPAEHFFFGANIGEWETGRVVGDVKAMGAYSK